MLHQFKLPIILTAAFLITDQLLPMLLNLLFVENEITPWFKQEPTLQYWYVIITFFFASIMFSSFRLVRLQPASFVFTLNKLSLNTLVMIFFLMSVYFFLNGLSGYRYDSSQGVGDSGFLFLYVSLKTYLQAYLFWYAVYQFRNKDLAFGSKLTANLILLGSALSITGTMSLFSTLLFFAVINMKSVKAIITEGVTMKSIYSTFASIIFGVLALGLTIVIGESVKRDLTIVEGLTYASELTGWYAQWILERLSVWYYTATHLSVLSAENALSTLNSWNIIIEAVEYRLDKLLGGNATKPFYQQIAHYNYFVLNQNPTLMDSGASAGIIGGGLYLFPIYMAPFVSALYLSIIIKMLKKIITYKISIAGILIICLMLRSYFLDPAGILLIFNQQAIFFIAIIWFYLHFRCLERHE
ncbi:hypothetical protein [Kangiella sp. TOML190]|uniref:hypothetical protein n=1 Tax=Kangiella sp. TOML190 TaxID=2931351 RepID=UPI00203AB2F1|nr:hypothetical protein [Kangiella sp. TOML190]